MDSTLGPYTRVTAVTQNMLNHGFKQLYDTYTELSSFDYTDADREWKVSLKLLPTQICIRGPEAIYLRLRYTIPLMLMLGPCPCVKRFAGC